MGTKYSEIYNMNKVIKNDPRLSTLDDCELSAIRFEYLKFAISYFIYDCRKNLNDRIDPVYSFYQFIADGVDDTFLLSPSPELNYNFVVYTIIGESKELVYNYTYDELNGWIKFDSVPVVNTVIQVKAYTNGEFNDTLDIREMNILSEGMIVPFLSEAKNDENMIKYIVTGKSLRFFSQANHISSMESSLNSQMYNTINSLISEYSYKGSEDSYRGLAGRGDA